MSLKSGSSKIRDAILKGIPSTGPPSLKSRWAKLRYRSPEGLDAAFQEALKVVKTDAAAHEEAAKGATDPKTKEIHLAKAKIHDPIVKYNHLVKHRDLSEPVYKVLAKRDWQRRAMLVLMQRLEQHHVIPDTLPTLAPEADVQLQFVTPTMRIVEPGEWIANSVCLRTPRINIRDFGIPAGQSAKYTVLIVNPDVPDLENDTFETFLHFAATNVEVSLVNSEANFSKSNVAVPYIPPHPEKNAPGQRLCVWVLRQSQDITPAELSRQNFDIRSFVESQQLQAVGAALWRTRYDRSSPKVREIYNLGPGRVFFRARTAKPEEALLHISERKKWMKIDGLLDTPEKTGEASQ